MSIDLAATVSAVTSFVENLLSGTGAERDTFELRAGPYMGRELRVVEMRGTEAISELYSFHFVVVSTEPPTSLRTAVLGMPACATFTVPDGEARDVQGIIDEVTVLGASPADGYHWYQLRLVPRMSLLALRKNTRVFQSLTTRQIIETILGEWVVASQWSLSRPLVARDYCVQYDETDLDFVSRIAAEEGIFFYFDHPSGLLDSLLGDLVSVAQSAVSTVTAAASAVTGAAGSTLSVVGSALAELGIVEAVVFSDSADYPAMGQSGGLSIDASVKLSMTGTLTASVGVETPTLRFRSLGDMSIREDYVTEFSHSRRVRGKSATVREFDFKKPAQPGLASYSLAAIQASSLGVTAALDLASSALTAATSLPSILDIPAIGLAPKSLETYDFMGTARYEPSVERAKRILDGQRRSANRAEGVSHCRRLSAGYKFALAEHAVESINGDYAVTRVEHRGTAPEAFRSREVEVRHVYSNHFECVPSRVRFRPEWQSRRPRQVVETATVVGPENEEIYTDSMGRIKVQFPWDRVGPNNETSSCWIRVAQTWAGAGWGFQFIPRIGMEVIVAFVFGDVDRPLVIGCVPNGLNPTPFQLPDAKSRSGIRSRSTPDATGANELWFEDLAGSELFHITAERDFEHETKRNSSIVVGTSGTGSQSTTVKTDYSLNVGHDQSIYVEGNRTDRVHGRNRVMLDGGSTRLVLGTERETTQGSRYLIVEQALSVAVRGNYATNVRGSSDCYVGENATEFIAGDRELTVSGSVSTSAGRAFAVASTGDVVLDAGQRLRLVCGNSFLELTDDGVTIVGPSVSIRGDVTTLQGESGSLHIEAGEAKLHASGAIEVQTDTTVDLYAKDAHVALSSSGGGEITVSGKHVLAQGESAMLDLASNAVVQATQVHLNPGDGMGQVTSGGSTPDELKTSWVGLVLVDQDGEAVPDARFQIKMSNGDIVEGALNADGKARIPVVPGSASVSFFDLDYEAWAASEATWITVPKKAKNHAVLDGEDMYAVAAKYGYKTIEVIWNHADNAEFIAKRTNPAQLFPGDIIVIPEARYGEATASEQTDTTFTVTRPTRTFSFTLRDEQGQGRSGVAYALTYGTTTLEGTTGSDGTIETEVKASVTKVTLRLDNTTTIDTTLGGINPMRNTPDMGASGVAQRLAAMGYDVGQTDGSDVDKLAAAVRLYQKAQAVEETGLIDETLFASLEKTYGQ